MKTNPPSFRSARRFFAALALGGLMCANASAQQMPQDNWQSYGLQFSSPTPSNSLSSIAIGSGGVYVGEIQSGSYTPTNILQFTEGGVFIRRFTTTFTQICGITCDPTGNVYVLDSGASTVTKLDSNGNFISRWGSAGSGNGQFVIIWACTNMIAADKNSQIYVCDPGNSRVQVFDSNGNFLRKWGQAGELPSQFGAGEPLAIAVAFDGRVVTCGGGAGGNGGRKFAVFDTNGTFITSVSFTYGAGYGADAIILQFSPDGLIATSTLINVYGVFFDANYSAVTGVPLSSYNYNYSCGGFSFSSRGDFYEVLQTKVLVYQRKYLSVQNSLHPPAIPLPTVLGAAQRSGTSWMDIDYKVTDADNPATGVTTGLLAFKNGGTTLNEVVPMNTFMEGTAAHVGANQPTGVPLHVTWNMAADWSVDYSQVQVEALAKDSRNLLGFQWITVPASGGNPAVQVSAMSITDAALLDVWFYLLATCQPGISLSNGTITGTADPYNGAVLASGVSTTAAGRQYLCGLMGVQVITPDQLTQAQGGNYGFTSLDTNSVAKLP